MADSNMEQLLVHLAGLNERISAVEATIASEDLAEDARELSTLDDFQAAQHLRSVDDSRIAEEFLILSDRLDHGTLVRICREFMQRSGPVARFTGVVGIGLALKETFDADVSRELATLIHNPEETTDLRLSAYCALVMINSARTPPTRETETGGRLVASLKDGNSRQTDVLDAVDWVFVNSFLELKHSADRSQKTIDE